MVVFYKPDRGSYILQPTKTAQLLQGFLNAQNTLNVKNGQLTQSDLDRYSRLSFFTADVNNQVVDYFTRNYAQIAPIDGNPDSISVDDLVIRRPTLPAEGIPVSPPPAGLFPEMTEADHKLKLKALKKLHDFHQN